MSRSNNSRKGSRAGNSLGKGFWSKRAESKTTGWSGKIGKKLTAKIERQINKPKNDDWT